MGESKAVEHTDLQMPRPIPAPKGQAKVATGAAQRNPCHFHKAAPYSANQTPAQRYELIDLALEYLA